MGDQIIFKIWYDGTLIWKPHVRYKGGESTIIQIEEDKISYFELCDYVMENGSYTTKNFLIYYLTPGKTLKDGLVLLRDDKDVFDMLKTIGDEFKHILHLYIQGADNSNLDFDQFQAQTKSVIVQSQLAQSSVVSPSDFTNPSPKSVYTSASAAHNSSEHESDPDDGSGDELGYEIVEEEEEVVGGADSDTEDEEYTECVQNTQNFNKELELAKNQIIQKVVEDQTDVEPEDGPVSSYEESDEYVHSPGESEDDDIQGKKNRLVTPCVSELTDWSKWKWVVGTRFETRDHFKRALKNYAVTNGRNLIITTSNKKRGGRLGVSCVKGCPFKLWLSFHDKKKCFMIKSVVDHHSCQRSMSKNRQLDQNFLADTFLPVFNTKPHWSAKEIQDAVKEKFKVIINPWLAYNAKRIAHKKLHGSMKEHYCKIGSYLAALRDANPSSTFELMTVPPTYFGKEPGTEVFFRLFICFDGVKRGFLEGCRKLLCLDGCFLKTFLGGMLLAAIGRDANDQMYPVAWAVVEGENKDSWTWFMAQLKRSLEVSNEGSGWTLISDQQKGLLNAVVSLWGKAEHRNCARHIYANWNKKHKGEELKGIFWRACRAYSVPDFKNAMTDMRNASPQAAEDFMKQNPKCFCRCYLDTTTKSDVIVNNMAETFNGYIVKSRSKHIINMLEDIRVAIMTRLTKMNVNMSSKDLIVCPRIQIKLNRRKDIAYRCEVFPSTVSLYQVKELDDVSVDLDNRTCSCRKWDITGYPCHHACAVLGFLGKQAEDYVHEQYSKMRYLKSYQYNIPPSASEKYWPDVDLQLDPPPIKIQPGRPKKNRRKDPHEDPKKSGKLTKHGCSVTCGNCKGKGHNMRRCPNPVNQSQTSTASNSKKRSKASEVSTSKKRTKVAIS